MNHRFRLAACALAAAFLTACGGGGDGGTDPTTLLASEPPPLAVNPAVPASTYSGDALALYQRLNGARLGAGAGALQQRAALDQAAAAHLGYLRSYGTASGHDEDPTRTGSTGASAGDRVQHFGYRYDMVREDLAWVSDGTPGQCLDLLLSTVYHLASLMSEETEVGLAFGSMGTGVNGCVFELARPWGGTPQLAPAGTLKTYPYADQNGVASRFKPATEVPNPFPELGEQVVGTPVYVSLRAQGADDKAGYAVTELTLRDAGGAAVPAWILAEPATQGTGLRPDARLRPGELFLVPKAPLAAGARYTVRFAGRNGAVGYATDWSFTTR